MIPLPMDTLFLLIVGLPLLLMGVLVLYYSLRSRHRSARLRENIYSCEHCGHVYAMENHRPMDRCPRCGTLNEAVRI